MTTLMYQEASSSFAKVANQLKLNKDITSSIVKIIKQKNIKRIITIARGSSDCVANFAKYLFETQLGFSVSSLPPSITTIYGKNIGDDKTLAIAISQSGGSPDLRLALEGCKQAGCITLAIVNVEKSPLAESADLVLPVRADAENAVAATKSVITSLVALVALVAEYNQDKTLLDALEALPAVLEKSLKSDWSKALTELQNSKNMFVIGRGFGFPIAQEMALKFKETCAIHAEAFSSAEVLHGPFALMNQTFTTFTILQHDESAEGTREIVKRMTDLGVRTVFATTDNQSDAKVHLNVDVKTHSILETIVLLQKFYLMVNDLALSLGFNPDNPDNLKKVTETV
ncbi:SIS domain-containing protein [Francisella hispaniensis]|uniref:Iron dicitrate transport regulator FecR n=1 Tax=Francisella hispaniensis FSC454 TaxID=1088883 RepID=A0AAC9J6L4_9GAMM|nr:SIS domain-containing protein [Francisella hispaniensis]APD50718.1 iron dicitrate transport regulator FecR [Francisella hispaniensis FSC454]KYW82875.1 iron dicitrate transport regulator FecR [Francisella hispaniensis FSC454]